MYNKVKVIFIILLCIVVILINKGFALQEDIIMELETTKSSGTSGVVVKDSDGIVVSSITSAGKAYFSDVNMSEIITDSVSARGLNGLYLLDDGENGIFIKDGGNVGIGTASPQAKLEINGGILKTGSTAYGTNADTHINLGNNSITGTSGQNYEYVTVCGGTGNTASAAKTIIGGGDWNICSAYASVIGGGLENQITGNVSFIGGGSENKTQGTYSVVCGGGGNTASESYSFVGSGLSNKAYGQYSMISGGSYNTASGNYSSISGGERNSANGNHSFAGGRYMSLTPDATGTFVWGYAGSSNNISTPYSFLIFPYGTSGNVGIGTASPQAKLEINGGILKTGSTAYGANADTHINLGLNSITGLSGYDYQYNTISGGYSNTASGNPSTIGGGVSNTASFPDSTVGGGYLNVASENNATVSGGIGNTASGTGSTVSGGYFNKASGTGSAVSGGASNLAGGDYSFAGGKYMHLTSLADNTFVYGIASSSQTIDTSNAFLIFPAGESGNVGIGTASPAYQLHITSEAAKPGGGSWADSSDKRLKKNIKSIDGEQALNKISQLEGVTYEWINPEEHIKGIRAGVTAQNLEQVFPSWVTEVEPQGKDKKLIPKGEKAKAISYPHDFNAYLIESIKELKKEIEELKKKIDNK